MPRNSAWAILLLAPALISAQDIQNMDISTLFGYAPAASPAVPGFTSRLEPNGGFALGVVYGYQFKQTSAGSLWLDMAQVFAFSDYTDPVTNRTYSNSQWFMAPGLRFQIPLPNDRFAFYLLTGFGYANRNDYRRDPVNPGSLQFGTQHTWTVPVGAGLIVRLSDRMGIKSEFRNFMTPAGSGTASSNHNPTFLFGISRHF